MSRRIQYFQVAPDALKTLAATKPYIESSNIEARLRALVENCRTVKYLLSALPAPPKT
jgi:hypothetical protein